MEIYFFMIIILLIASVLGTLNRLLSELERTRVMLQKMAQQIGVLNPLPDHLDDELRQLIAKGKKIEAIKRYREATGAGLIEAKKYVDSLDS